MVEIVELLSTSVTLLPVPTIDTPACPAVQFTFANVSESDVASPWKLKQFPPTMENVDPTRVTAVAAPPTYSALLVVFSDTNVVADVTVIEAELKKLTNARLLFEREESSVAEAKKAKFAAE